MHVLSGFILEQRGLSVNQAVMASIAFELVENTLGPKLGIVEQEGQNNMVMDIVFNMVGYFASQKIRED